MLLLRGKSTYPGCSDYRSHLSYHELWRVVGHVCDLFSEEVCYNFFNAAGYKSN